MNRSNSLALPSRVEWSPLYDAAWSEETKRTIWKGWKRWAAWCSSRQIDPLPVTPRMITDYLESQTKQVPSVLNAVKSINMRYKLSGIPSPTKDPLVLLALRGFRKLHGRPEEGRAALTMPLLRQVMAHVDCSTPAGKRDAAVLLLGWWAALRRKTLADMLRTQVTPTSDGYRVELGRHKTDQMGLNRDIVLVVHRHEVPAICCPCALDAWLEVTAEHQTWISQLFCRSVGTGIVPRPLSGNAIWAMVKRRVAAAGYDPSRFGAHSLRAGLVTTAISQGASTRDIQSITKHKSEAMLLRYHREVEAGPQYIGRTLKVD